MEPMDDRELRELLREWKAPEAPHLRPPTVPARQPWWAWLLTGSIRVPVPVGIAAALLVGFLFYWGAPEPAPPADPPAGPQPVVSLADFQPVEDVELRVVGGAQ